MSDTPALKCPCCGNNLNEITDSVPKILRKGKRWFACGCAKVTVTVG